MSYNEDLQGNNALLQKILEAVNALPEAGNLDAETVQAIVETALAEAKASGAFDGKDGDSGRGIQSIARTSGNGAAGTVDTYTVTYTDGTTSTYQVRNGGNGITPHIGANGNWYLGDTDTGVKAQGDAATLEIAGVESLPYGSAPTVKENEGSTATARSYTLYIPESKPESINAPPARVFLNGNLPSDKSDGEWPLSMAYISETERFTAYATAKVQGSSSTTFAKKNYTLKLYADDARSEKLKKTFRNWPAKSKFVIKANTIDRTHARNVVSCRIWGDMARSRSRYNNLPAELRDSPNMGAIDGFPVKVYLNGVYQGLYTWNIPKDDWMAGLDSDQADKHAILCAEGNTNAEKGYYGPEQLTFNRAYTSNAEVITGYDWSDEIETVGDTIRANFKAFSDLVVSGTDEEFSANISTYVDLESLIDTFIYIWLACGVDSLGKNQFLYTYNAGLPWYSGVYDLDSTWGLTPSGDSLTAYNTIMQDGYLYPKNKGLKNRLYERLWALFTEEVRDRWNIVKESALSLANIINHFEAFHDAIPAGLFAEDSADTTAGGAFVATTDSNNKGFDRVLGIDKNNLQQIRNFAAARWHYVDGQINLVPCTGLGLSASSLSLTADNVTAALVATLTPADCNEAVVWTTTDDGVATVSGGTVTAIYNGSCTITATCGEYSASCTVTVSGFVTPGSINLADPTSADWLKGYIFSGSINCSTATANKPHRTITNYIEFKIGDVFTIDGCQALYGNNGFAHYAVYDLNKSAIRTFAVKEMLDSGEITVADGVTTIRITKARTDTYPITDKVANGGYIRFQLGMYDGQSDIDTENIVILRNPNGENAEAWRG